MSIPWELILGFAVGLAILYALGNLLLAPKKLLWRLTTSAVLGALALAVLNFIGPLLGIRVAINPVTALVAGSLGLPGVILVVLMTLML